MLPTQGRTEEEGSGIFPLLVPQLHLGTRLSGRFHFLYRAGRTKDHFANKGMPKCILGTRRGSRLPNWRAGVLMVSPSCGRFPATLDIHVMLFMKIETITSAEAEARADALGKTFTPGSEEEFAAFEEKYLGAYDLI